MSRSKWLSLTPKSKTMGRTKYRQSPGWGWGFSARQEGTQVGMAPSPSLEASLLTLRAQHWTTEDKPGDGTGARMQR